MVWSIFKEKSHFQGISRAFEKKFRSPAHFKGVQGPAWTQFNTPVHYKIVPKRVDVNELVEKSVLILLTEAATGAWQFSLPLLCIFTSCMNIMLILQCQGLCALIINNKSIFSHKILGMFLLFNWQLIEVSLKWTKLDEAIYKTTLQPALSFYKNIQCLYWNYFLRR